MATTTSTTLPVPGPRSALGWRGNLLPFYRDLIGITTALHRRYGDVITWLGNAPGAYFAFGARYNHQLLSDAEHFHVNPVGVRVPRGSALERLGSGLVAMNGTRHKQQRRLMLPAFHKKFVDTYRDEMVQITQTMLDRWQPEQQRSIAHAMQQLTMLVAGRTFFGLDTEHDAQEMGSLIKRGLATNLSPSVVLFQHDLPGTPYRNTLRLAAQIEAKMQAMIRAKRAALEQHHDVVSLLMQARDEDGTTLTDAELIGQAYTVFVAGHETSATALTWTLFLLAQHPAVLADVVDEVRSVLQGDAPTAQQVQQLPLLERVIKESMRLLPPAAFMLRVSQAPFVLDHYALPAKATVILSPYHTHRDAQLYPEPLRFMPRRWETIAPTAYEYVPFGAGAHMCIGATFAMFEMKLVLAMVLQRYRLSMQPNQLVDRQLKFMLEAKGGLPMTVHPQDRQFGKTPVRGNIHEMVNLAA